MSRLLGHDGLLVGGDTEAPVHAEALRLHVEPAHDARHLFALRRFRGQHDLAADVVVLLEQHYVMTARLRHARRFQSCRTRADHDHLALRPARLGDHVRHCFFARGRGVLHAQHVEPVVLAVDAIIRADALLDFVLATIANLDDHMRIGDLRARHADQIDHAAGQQALGLASVANTLRVHDGQLHH